MVVDGFWNWGGGGLSLCLRGEICGSGRESGLSFIFEKDEGANRKQGETGDGEKRKDGVFVPVRWPRRGRFTDVYHLMGSSHLVGLGT